jgi:hypothetical protein
MFGVDVGIGEDERFVVAMWRIERLGVGLFRLWYHDRNKEKKKQRREEGEEVSEGLHLADFHSIVLIAK